MEKVDFFFVRLQKTISENFPWISIAERYKYFLMYMQRREKRTFFGPLNRNNRIPTIVLHTCSHTTLVAARMLHKVINDREYVCMLVFYWCESVWKMFSRSRWVILWWIRRRPRNFLMPPGVKNYFLRTRVNSLPGRIIQ